MKELMLKDRANKKKFAAKCIVAINNMYLGSRKTSKGPSKRPLGIPLQQGIFLFNTIPNPYKHNFFNQTGNLQIIISKKSLSCTLKGLIEYVNTRVLQQQHQGG